MLEEVAGIAGSIHINSPMLSFFIFICSCFMSYIFMFQKYIKHEQCGFPQEDVCFATQLCRGEADCLPEASSVAKCVPD
jgi:hypothetical protein